MSARAIHRRLAWVAGVVAVLWAATGFLHPILSWTAPRPAVQAPLGSFVRTEGVIAPGPAFAAAGVREATLVRLVEVAGKRFWLATTADGARMALDAETGAEAKGVEEARAVLLARHYAAAPDGEIAFARKVDRFSVNYPPVNKLLPVWEVRFARPDGLTMYVEPGADRLAMTTNDQRRVLLALFQNIHTLKFLEGVEPLRLAVLAALIASVLITTAFGAWMLFSARGQGVRRWHKLVAGVALPFIVAFPVSGLFHLFVTSSLNDAPPPRAASFEIARVTTLPRPVGVTAADVSVSAGAQGPVVRYGIEGMSGVYFDGAGKVLAANDASEARRRAGASATASVKPITAFSAAYGFVNKRLPVLQVGEGETAVFVDPREGLVAARAERGVKAVEAWSFDVTHKWEPVADQIGRRNRDYLTMLAVALIAASALMGLALAAGRKRKEA